MARKEALVKADLIAALEKYQGLVYLTASVLKVSAQTIYNYAERYPEVKQKIKELKGQRLDKAELVLWNEVNSGNTQALMFFLRTQGKDRGYVERTEVNENITINLTREDLEALPDDVLEQLAENKSVDLTPYTRRS